jgi:hypothetical protein
VSAVAGFIVRLAGYAILLGIAARLAQWLWEKRGLDGVAVLQAPHETAVAVIALAPIVLALLGVGLLRRVALFVAWFLVGAVLTAPFAFARFAAG